LRPFAILAQAIWLAITDGQNPFFPTHRPEKLGAHIFVEKGSY
jgi:hypothetical protein